MTANHHSEEVPTLRTRRLVIGIVVVTVVTVVAAAVVGVYAAPREGGDGQGDGAAWLMDRHDANGDGKIDRDEFRGPENAFVRMDANGDGVITRSPRGAVRGIDPAGGAARATGRGAGALRTPRRAGSRRWSASTRTMTDRSAPRSSRAPRGPSPSSIRTPMAL